MQRKWAVRPDQGEMLSREALIAALIDGAVMLDLAGGCLEVVVGRAPTVVPGEMVMTGAVVCWKDRTDARPQTEHAVAVVPYENVSVAGEPIAAPTPSFADTVEREVHERAKAASIDRPESAEPSAERDPDDGFDYSGMPNEDLEDAPAALR